VTEPTTPVPRVSVVIPTYGRRDSVARALRALKMQTLSPDDFEVVVSIDGSEDGTRELVAGFDAPFALTAVWHPNQGRARACNAGIAAARGELVVILDDDMEAAPGLLAGHLAAHPAGSRRAVVGAAPMLADPDSPPLVRYYASGFNGRQAELARPGRALGFREAYSGNFSIRREVMLEVGGFDPDFRVYGHEDYELALRLQRAGVELRFSAEALAHQHYEKEFPALARDSISRGSTAVVFAGKHPEVVETLPLGRNRRGPRWWRWTRAGLLVLGRVAPRTPEAVTALVLWLERRRFARLRRVYSLALDYFYWLGVRRAQREAAVRPALAEANQVAEQLPAPRRSVAAVR
jgi:GT2 family glycosyltransferase